MPRKDPPLQRKHTQLDFWLYISVFLCLGAGFFIWIVEFIDTGRLSHVGTITMLIGVWGMMSMENRRLKQRVEELETRLGASDRGQASSE